VGSSFPRSIIVIVLALVYSEFAFCGEIHDAAMRGDLERVRALLKADPDLVFSKDHTRDSLDGYDSTPLHAAALSGHKDVAEFLLNNKADVNAKDWEGQTPLHDAAKNGHKDVVELLASKAEIDAKDNSGFTPLHMAAIYGHKDVVKLMIANGAEYNIGDAAVLGDLEQVKALLNGHPDLVSSKDTNGMTPLHWAAQRGHKAMVKLLLANKADVNAMAKDGMTPLFEAAMYDNLSKSYTDVAEMLLANKADVNIEANGEILLDSAVFGGHKDMTKLLLAKGAKCSIHDAAFLGDLEKIKALLKSNPDLVACKDSLGFTPLLWAVCAGRKDVAELLLANKADVNATDNGGSTPMLRAKSWGNKDMVEWLQQHGGHE